MFLMYISLLVIWKLENTNNYTVLCSYYHKSKIVILDSEWNVNNIIRYYTHTLRSKSFSYAITEFKFNNRLGIYYRNLPNDELYYLQCRNLLYNRIVILTSPVLYLIIILINHSDHNLYYWKQPATNIISATIKTIL